MHEGQLVDALALAGQPVEAFAILNDPRAIFPANERVKTRDALRWDMDVAAGEAANRVQFFVERIFACYLSVHLHDDTRFDTCPRFIRAIRLLCAFCSISSSVAIGMFHSIM